MSRIYLLALSLLLSSGAWAQKTYFSSHFAENGDSFLVSQVSPFDLGNEDFRPTGANVIWDHHNLYPYAQRIRSFTTPNATGFLPSYLLTCAFNCFNTCYNDCLGTGGINIICTGLCNTQCNTNCLTSWANNFNLAELTNDSINLGITSLTQVYNLYKKDNAGLYQNGIGARISNVPLVMAFDSPDRVYKFPLRFGDSTTSVSSYAVKLDSIPGTGINFSFSYKHAQTRSNYVDGWGTLITPYATYDSVLKHRSVIHNRDSVTVFGNTITLGDFIPSQFVPDTVIEYSWFDRSEGVPVLKVTAWLINGDEIYQSAEYRDTVRCFDPYAVFGYLPIPATLENGDDSVEVNFYSLSFNANTFTWDFDDPNGNNTVTGTQSPSHWYSEGGIYSVTLTICNTACAQGLCDDVTLPVLVIDNRTVGILGPENNNQSWSIGPNPFTNSLSIEYNGSVTEQPRFSLMDLAGRNIALPAPENDGSNRYTWKALDGLAEGVYLLYIHQGDTQQAIRVVKMD